jgi:uncharacterized membrane protein YfcA
MGMVLELVAIGAFTGLVSGYFGVGGGLVLIPLLMLMEIDMKSAIAIATLQMMFSSYFGSFLNYKKGTLELKTGLYIGLGGLLGALGSGYVVTVLSAQTLSIILLLFILFSIYRFFNAPLEHDKVKVDNRVIHFVVGCGVGLISVSVGLGGAMLITPILVGLMHYKIKEAVSIALFFVIFSSTSGFISMSYFGLIDYQVAIIVAVASLVGVYIGITLAHKTNPKAFKSYTLMLNIVAISIITYKLF